MGNCFSINDNADRDSLFHYKNINDLRDDARNVIAHAISLDNQSYYGQANEYYLKSIGMLREVARGRWMFILFYTIIGIGR